jgi:GT2 family glycosyltransferase
VTLLGHHPELLARLAEPEAELITPEALAADLEAAIAGFDLDEPWWESHPRLVLEQWPELAGFAFPWSLGVTGNLSVPRAAAEQVGLLDERFVGWGLEDTDLHFRLHRAGATTVVLAGGLGYHQVHRRGPELAWEWARNAIYLLDKHASLELALWIAVCRRRLSLGDAQRIADDHAALGPGPHRLASELVRGIKDHLRAWLAVVG